MTLDPAAAERQLRRGRGVTLFGLAALAALFVVALRFTPPERYQGLAQKIFYVHPPAAYAMQLAFVLMGVASILYLLLKDERFDCFAEASAEVGLLFGGIVVLTGPLWGKPIWGTWWTWEDPRLGFTIIQLLLAAGYFALRSAVRDPVERARFSAVMGVMALLLVPFNHLTVYLFASQHPRPVVLAPERPKAPWEMLRVFFGGLLTFTILYLGFVMQRYGIAVRHALREERIDA